MLDWIRKHIKDFQEKRSMKKSKRHARRLARKQAKMAEKHLLDYAERDYLAEWNAEHPEEFMDLRLRTIEDEMAERRFIADQGALCKEKHPTDLISLEEVARDPTTNADVDDDAIEREFDCFVQTRRVSNRTCASNQELVGKFITDTLPSDVPSVGRNAENEMETLVEENVSAEHTSQKATADLVIRSASLRSLNKGNTTDTILSRMDCGLFNFGRMNITTANHAKMGFLILYDTFMGLELRVNKELFKFWQNVSVEKTGELRRSFSSRH